MKAFAVWLDETTERWDLKGARAAIFRAHHPDFVPMGTFIEEQSISVRPFEKPEKEWPVYGVSNKEGVFLSHYQKGVDFRVPYKHIEKDWFFHNPTRANVGSLGRVPEIEPDAVTSPEYQIWRIKDPEWLPDYVEALIKMPFFNLMVHVHRVGAVKERLYARNLLEIAVPPRTKLFQIALVKKWKTLLHRVAQAEARIATHEEALVADVLAASGIEINPIPAREKAYAMDLDTIERWGVGFNRHRWTLDDLLGSKQWQRVPLSSVARVNPGRTRTTAPGTRVTFVPMEAVSERSGAIEAPQEVFLEEVSKGYTAFEEGDLVWAKITPCMQNGKSAVARGLKNGVGFGSTEFHVVRVFDPSQVLPEYLWVLLRLKSVRHAAIRYFIGSAGQQRTPADFLEGLVIPLPDLTAQKAIVEGVLTKRLAVESERKAIDRHRADMIKEIERDILTGKLTATPLDNVLPNPLKRADRRRTSRNILLGA